jgi:ComF family protein
MRLNKRFRRSIGAFLKAVFPDQCLICGSLYHQDLHPGENRKGKTFLHQNDDSGFAREMAPYLCGACSSRFVPIDSPMCPRCGMMFDSRQGEDHLCQGCAQHPKYFARARSLGIYEDRFMKMIHAFKYGGKIQLARPLGRILFKLFISHWDIEEIDAVMPVPLHPRRLRSRGFNQSFLLVHQWPELSGRLDFAPKGITLDCKTLCRQKWTRPQTGLNRKERMVNIQKAFYVKDPLKVAQKRILVVDDVFTTGATLDECARVLIEAGAAQVHGLTLARA